MRALWMALLGLGLACLSAPSASTAEAPARAILVLDASGSMLAKVGGRPKIDIAREVVRTILKDWNPAVQLGVEVYGHRSKGDCDDIQTLVPVGPVDAAAIVKALADVKPKGKTPLSRAVRLAGEQLAYTEEPATVILVTDGKETCDPDPCAAAADLKAKGVDFKLHVVGFALEPGDKAQLQCMAEKTGGVFLSADNAGELGKALAQTAQLAATPAPPPPPAKAEPVLRARTVAVEGGEPLRDNLSYEVLKAETDLEGKRERVGNSYDAQPVFKLPPGRYVVTVKYGANESNAVAEAEVELTDAGPADATLVLDAGAARLATLPVAGAQPLKAALAYEVEEAEADLDGTRRSAAVSYDPEPLFRLKAGAYHVKVKWGANESNAEAEGDLTVEAGKGAQSSLVLDAGVLKAKTVAAPNGPPLGSGLSYAVHAKGSELEEDNAPLAASSYDAQPAFKLKAGSYRVTVERSDGSNGKASTDVEVQAGKAGEVTLDLSSED